MIIANLENSQLARNLSFATFVDNRQVNEISNLNIYNMWTAIMAIGLIGSFFALMAVRLIFLKNGEFKGTCASQSPFLNPDGGTCSYCGKDPEFCENKDDSKKDLPQIA